VKRQGADRHNIVDNRDNTRTSADENNSKHARRDLSIQRRRKSWTKKPIRSPPLYAWLLRRSWKRKIL